MELPTVTSFTSVIQHVLPEPHAGLLSGISFGTKAALSKDLMRDLTTTGTLHIIALSGMNISIVMKVVSDTLLRFCSRRITSLITIILIIGFVGFVGPSASVIRAAIMGSLSLLAVLFGRSNWPLFSWVVAVSGMLLVKPDWVGDISFQLSALATLGIILFGGKSKNFIFENLRTTLSAQVFTIPIIFLNFHRISIISPLPNVLIGPVIAPLTVMGWVVGFLGSIWYPLGYATALISWVLLQYLIFIITITAAVPFASLHF